MNDLIKLAQEKRIRQIKIDLPLDEGETLEIRLYTYSTGIPYAFTGDDAIKLATQYLIGDKI